jgi:hypothetical protein
MKPRVAMSGLAGRRASNPCHRIPVLPTFNAVGPYGIPMGPDPC